MISSEKYYRRKNVFPKHFRFQEIFLKVFTYVPFKILVTAFEMYLITTIIEDMRY